MKKAIPWHSIIKLLTSGNKGKTLKTARVKRTHYIKGIKMKTTTAFSSESMHARRQWSIIFKVLKEKKST